jgi:glycosyltransferase involved in cell wall biosynthesis
VDDFVVDIQPQPAAKVVPVSVIVPTIGRTELLRACLVSVLACDPAPDEVVVVDQSGHDGVSQVANDLADHRIRVVRCAGRGIARATNAGIRAACNDAVLVTHDDCTIARDWVSVALGHFHGASPAA